MLRIIFNVFSRQTSTHPFFHVYNWN